MCQYLTGSHYVSGKRYLKQMTYERTNEGMGGQSLRKYGECQLKVGSDVLLFH